MTSSAVTFVPTPPIACGPLASAIKTGEGGYIWPQCRTSPTRRFGSTPAIRDVLCRTLCRQHVVDDQLARLAPQFLSHTANGR